MKISLIIPARNEASVIAETVRRVHSTLADSGRPFELIVGDSASKDATADIVRTMDLPNLRLVSASLPGKGRILSAAIEEATGGYVGFIDADLEIDVGYLSELIQALDRGADVAVASKTLQNGDATRPLGRRIATRALNLAVRNLLGTPLSDHQAGLKLFRSGPLRQVLGEVQITGWLWDSEVLVHLHRSGAEIVEIPVELTGRPRSTERLRGAIWEAARDLFSLWRRTTGKKKDNPQQPDASAGKEAQEASGVLPSQR